MLGTHCGSMLALALRAACSTAFSRKHSARMPGLRYTVHEPRPVLLSCRLRERCTRACSCRCAEWAQEHALDQRLTACSRPGSNMGTMDREKARSFVVLAMTVR